MASLLIRDMQEETKRALAVQAARHGRSQQAEALAILESALAPQRPSLVDFLRQGAREVGGIEAPVAERHAPRITGVAL